MNTTKKLLVLLLALCCIGITAIPSYAAEAQPMVETIYDATAFLSIIAIQGISRGYQRQKTNLHSPMDESAKRPQ